MANLTASLRLSGNKQYAFSSNKTYDQVFNLEQELDNGDTFIKLTVFKPDTTAKATGVLQDAKFVCINNPSAQTIEVAIVIAGITSLSSDTVGTASDDANVLFVLRPGEFFILPSIMFVNNDAYESAMNGTDIALDNEAPAAAGHLDSGADVDHTTSGSFGSSTTATLLYLEPYTSAANCTANIFKVGDLIRIEDEIMEVTAIGDKSDLANNTLTVKRGMHGTTAATHADDTAVSLAYFNAFQDTVNMIKTDLSGNYKATNLLGKGRTLLTTTMDGWNRGTIAIKFYTEGGYQEFGMSNVTAGTRSGLAASTEYGFNITVDGGSTFVDLSFTTDSANLNFGGVNGIVDKINLALKTQYYTAGNLFEKSVTCSIVNGDIRFTSNSNNSATAILLANPGSVTNIFGVGRIPVIGNIEEAIASKLPEDTISVNGVSSPNSGAFMFDDGNGRLTSGELGSGTIDYDSGAITIIGGPSDAEFVVSGISGGALGCGGNTEENSLMIISARSTNSKRHARVQVLAFD